MHWVNMIDELERLIGARELNACINVSLKHNYVYVSNPKVATSTIKFALNAIELAGTGLQTKKVHAGPFNSPFVRPFQMSEEAFANFMNSSDVFVFSVVRNPFTRLASCFLDKIRGNTMQKTSILEVLGHDPDHLHEEVSFEQFIEAIRQQSAKQMNRHWRPQSVQLMTEAINYDFIGRFENLPEDFKFIDQKLNHRFLPSMPPRARNVQNAKDSIKRLYPPKLKKAVLEIYEDDFKTFGYSEELPLS